MQKYSGPFPLRTKACSTLHRCRAPFVLDGGRVPCLSLIHIFCEQRKAIEKLKEEIQALDKKKVDEGTHKGELVQRIHQLEYETLPDCCQQFTRIEDSINETFSVDYQQSVGIPRYQQEFARLRRADAILSLIHI